MTLLSQSLELLRRARAMLRELEAEEARAEARSAPIAPMATSSEIASASVAHLAAPTPVRELRRLRLVKSEEAATAPVANRDSAVAKSADPSSELPGAAVWQAFVAGVGARLYSLDAWRREHPPRRPAPHAA